MPKSLRPSRIVGVAALSALLIIGGAVAAQAVDEPTATLNPPHVWVDPTSPAGEYHLSVEIHFPLPAGIWDFKSEKLLIVEPQADCTAEVTDYGLLYACDGVGDPIPGEYTVGLVTHVVGGGTIPPIPAIPITVCPLTGCSDLFDLTVDAAASPACASDLSSLGTVAYRFNVPWNASGVAFGSIPGVSDADWQASSETVADGAGFALQGAIGQPGTYTLPITVTDEFGGLHSTTLSFDVVGAGSPACLRLAATGPDAGVTTVWMLVFLATGTALLLSARRRRRA